MKSNFNGLFAGSFTAWILIAVVFGGLYGCPRYRVYQQRMEGEAELQRATANRQIKTLEAKAEKESALFKGEAEVIRATKAAEATNIIKSSLSEEYLRYLWIQGLSNGKNEVIYLPTEAGLPILEANRARARAPRTEAAE
ncbi:membrane protease subunit [Rufibacter quisquiliarum]|uniref:Regulator of protease activity HflC (Stomatin/prohibitin superfamily) n=1 Tax=Rufibacter quisquiliarum TaxID=1549639 RepID=A0A839GBL8_9BACT|nr:membrane protease subunit [Rufibacter quisquiliarum]MBA9076332.1 regulator of protease activity HflC (stomatin/prohibitin superfamily) [Rufibacter quisquiliarum]